MITVNNKYKIKEKVWVWHRNVALRITIAAISVMVEGRNAPVVRYYGSTMETLGSFMEPECFRTKKELLADPMVQNLIKKG
jgi:hypothetical protein